MTTQWTLCRTQSNAHVTSGVVKSWNSACVPVLEYTCKRIEAGSRYGAYLMGRLRTGHASDLETYACRSIRGSSAHSEHSHACAMDIRPFANPMSDRGFLVTDFDKFGASDGERFLHSIGDPIPGIGPLWQWGGGLYSNSVNTWIACYRRRGSRITSGRVDAMHFEVDDGISPADAARLKVMHLAQEDELTPDDKKWLAQQFADIDKQFADLRAKTDRVDAYMTGVAEGMTNAGDAGGDATPVERAGFRATRASNKILGL